jgi:hypothetical protein
MSTRESKPRRLQKGNNQHYKTDEQNPHDQQLVRRFANMGSHFLAVHVVAPIPRHGFDCLETLRVFPLQRLVFLLRRDKAAFGTDNGRHASRLKQTYPLHNGVAAQGAGHAVFRCFRMLLPGGEARGVVHVAAGYRSTPGQRGAVVVVVVVTTRRIPKQRFRTNGAQLVVTQAGGDIRRGIGSHGEAVQILKPRKYRPAAC